MAEQLLLGTRKGLLTYEKQGGEWRFCRESFRAQPVNYAMVDPRTGTRWAALDHGHWGAKLHRSTDGGDTWTEIPAPVYPEGAMKADGFPSETEEKLAPATTTYIWLIQPGGNDQPNRLYIGTEPGGLFQTDDGGDTWQIVEGLWNRPERLKWWFGGGRDNPGLCSICVDPRDSSHVMIGISVGGVYETRDGGKTWDARNKGLSVNYMPEKYPEFGHDPHFMAMHPSNPDVLWQQNHCGIFRTEDAGKQWTDISQEGGPAYFGFPIALDVNDPETAWVVPAVDAEFRVAVEQKLCVCRTEDGGKTWTALRNGLPQQESFDVVFRHALDIDGDTLVFGTTTGNLYVSDDRGNSWRALAHNLPPVYSVRFANR